MHGIKQSALFHRLRKTAAGEELLPRKLRLPPMLLIRHHRRRKLHRLLNRIACAEHHRQRGGIPRGGELCVDAPHGRDHLCQQCENRHSPVRTKQNTDDHERDRTYTHENQHAFSNADADAHGRRCGASRHEAKAIEHTLKHRQHADHKDRDHDRKHHDQNARIKDCALDRRLDLRFPLIVVRKRGHHLVELAGAFSDASHGKQVAWENACFLQRFRKCTPALQRLSHAFKARAISAARIAPREGLHAVSQRNARLEHHGYLLAKERGLVRRKRFLRRVLLHSRSFLMVDHPLISMQV